MRRRHSPLTRKGRRVYWKGRPIDDDDFQMNRKAVKDYNNYIRHLRHHRRHRPRYRHAPSKLGFWGVMSVINIVSFVALILFVGGIFAMGMSGYNFNLNDKTITILGIIIVSLFIITLITWFLITFFGGEGGGVSEYY